MKKTLLALLLLTACSAFAAAPPTFVLPTSAKGTNLQLTTPAITGGTNTGQLITGATITGSLTGTNAVLTTPAITGGTNTGSIITGATITGSLTGTNAVLTTPAITGGTNTGSLITGATITGSLTGTNAVLTTPAITGGTNSSALFLNSTLTGFTSSLQTNTDLTASRVLVSDAEKRITNSTVSTTTLGYLDATSSIQTQLNAKLAATNGTASGGTFTGATNLSVAVVAINTASPSNKLHVSSGGLDINTARFSYDGSNYLEIAHNRLNMVGAGPFVFQASGVNKASLTTDGNLGLAGATATYPLTVTGNASISGYLGLSGAAPNSSYSVLAGSHIAFTASGANARWIVIDSPNGATNTGALGMQAGGGSIGWGGGLMMFGHSHATKPGWVSANISFNSGTAGTADEGRFVVNDQGLASGNNVFTVTRSGKVGIGSAVTVPQYSLDVNGQARLLGTNAMRFGGTTGATDDVSYIREVSSGIMEARGTSAIRLWGNVVAGSANGVTPLGSLHASGSGTALILAVNSQGNSPTANLGAFSINTTNVLTVMSNATFGIRGTITAPGTTGAQTINKPVGSVNLAAAATSLVVTNSCVGSATDTIVLLTVGSNDTTAKSCAVVVGTGQFTIYPDAAPTAETVVFFQVIRVL